MNGSNPETNDSTILQATLEMITGPPCEPTVPGVLAELFSRLDRFESRIPLAVLERELTGLQVTRAELEGLCCFDARCYKRNSLHHGPAYEALLLCWRGGQESPIHDHAGSSCAFRILDGIATETLFDLDPSGLVRPQGADDMATGTVCAAQDADIHKVTNFQRCDLVTLHIYSPALATMQFYEPALQ